MAFAMNSNEELVDSSTIEELNQLGYLELFVMVSFASALLQGASLVIGLELEHLPSLLLEQDSSYWMVSSKFEVKFTYFGIDFEG